MKKFFITLLCVAAALQVSHSFAQEIDYNYIIPPASLEELTIEEKLVKLAWNNNPVSSINENNIEIAKHNLNIVNVSWLENIRVTGNVNEFVINPGSDLFNRAQFFPLYNISASINLDEFVTNPQRSKIAKLEYQNELETNNQQKLFIRAEVLRRYHEYKLQNQILEIQTEKTENALNNFNLVEEQFLDGETTLEIYNAAYNNHKNEQISLQRSQYNLDLAIVALEEIVGINIEEILSEN